MRIRLTFSMVVVALACILGQADTAWAWGPAVHVGLGGAVLDQLSLLPGAVAAILARHSLAYLYGNIAADVVFAKRMSRVKQFCHHWSTGFKLLHAAENERDQAFAYGYLSHLAADTVAHGKYVPHQIVVSGQNVNFGHLYWELRADAAQKPGAWRTLEWIICQNHGAHHLHLKSHLTDTLLSYGVNRRLFHTMNAITVRRTFRRSMDAVNRYSRWPLPSELMAGYLGDSVERIQSILTDGHRSPLLYEDPNGTSALMNLHVRNREMRRIKRPDAMIRRRAEVSAGLRPRPKPPLAAPDQDQAACVTAQD